MMFIFQANTVRSQKEESRMRHPVPPNGAAAPRVQVARSRPHSTASFASIGQFSSYFPPKIWKNPKISRSCRDFTGAENHSCSKNALISASSGMENISWRNSTASSNSDQQKRMTIQEEDIGPRVVSNLPFHFGGNWDWNGEGGREEWTHLCLPRG